MRPALLANENIPRQSVLALRQAGYDVHYIAETAAGLHDEQVLSLAVNEGRWVLTFDRDYGELIFGRRRTPPPCVIYFRLLDCRPEEAAQLLLPLLVEPQRFIGQFVVLSADGYRNRPLLALR